MSDLVKAQLLAALREDAEWTSASFRLLYNHLEPLEEVCSGDPETLGRVVELRRRIQYAVQALNDLLDQGP